MTNIVCKKLIIELKSDLIAGSGSSWGSIIDTDVVHDQYGFPYIPSKRIRGLIKEAVLELEQFGLYSEGTSIQLLGDSDHEGHHFKLYNAYLENYEDMINEVKNIDNQYKSFVHDVAILNHYTSVRYQTAIDDDGIAKDNSLRSSRVIDKGLKFYAHIEYEKEDEDIINKSLKMIHHMGINRTRGFGEVDVYLDKKECKLERKYLNKLKADKYYDIKLLLKNEGQLVLGNNALLSYIPGSSFLGYFANQYLNKHKDDNRFYDLFVKGNVKFLNAYISDEQWNNYYPNRLSLFKEKTGSMYYDKTSDAYKDGNKILSKIRNKYVNDKHEIQDVNTEMYYHHKRPEDKSIGHVVDNNDKNGMFYQLEVISSNQHFIAHVLGKGKDLKDVMPVLFSPMQIGQSKKTQYGNVRIVDVKVEERKEEIIKQGTHVVCTLRSPLLLVDHKRESDLSLAHLAEVLHIDDPEYFVDYTKVSGYNAKWKLQKPVYTAFSSGSCIKGILKEDVNKEDLVGYLTQEGLGHISYECVSNELYDYKNYEYKGDSKIKVKYLSTIIANEVQKQLYLNTLSHLDDIPVSGIISKTLLGRLLKMLENHTWEEFITDTKGIADKKKNEDVEKLVKKVTDLCDELYMVQKGNEFLQDYVRKEYYMYTMKQLLTKNKVERREV